MNCEGNTMHSTDDNGFWQEMCKEYLCEVYNFSRINIACYFFKNCK